MVATKKIAYICDCKKSCSRFDTCQKTCFHTTNSLHAKYGILKDVADLKTPQFEYIGACDEVEYYIERMGSKEVNNEEV